MKAIVNATPCVAFPSLNDGSLESMTDRQHARVEIDDTSPEVGEGCHDCSFEYGPSCPVEALQWPGQPAKDEASDMTRTCVLFNRANTKDEVSDPIVKIYRRLVD